MGERRHRPQYGWSGEPVRTALVQGPPVLRIELTQQEATELYDQLERMHASSNVGWQNVVELSSLHDRLVDHWGDTPGSYAGNDD